MSAHASQAFTSSDCLLNLIMATAAWLLYCPFFTVSYDQPLTSNGKL